MQRDGQYSGLLPTGKIVEDIGANVSRETWAVGLRLWLRWPTMVLLRTNAPGRRNTLEGRNPLSRQFTVRFSVKRSGETRSVRNRRLVESRQYGSSSSIGIAGVNIARNRSYSLVRAGRQGSFAAGSAWCGTWSGDSNWETEGVPLRFQGVVGWSSNVNGSQPCRCRLAWGSMLRRLTARQSLHYSPTPQAILRQHSCTVTDPNDSSVEGLAALLCPRATFVQPSAAGTGVSRETLLGTVPWRLDQCVEHHSSTMRRRRV